MTPHAPFSRDSIEERAARSSTFADPLRFSVRTRRVEYGDNRVFHDYRIVIWRGEDPVGALDGPDRTFRSPLEARAGARRRIEELRTHRLFAIDVTRKDLANGVGRSCETCAIAQALWRNQERMGFDRNEFNVMVEPYGGMFGPECRGIVISPHAYDKPDMVTTVEAMPDVVFITHRGELGVDSMLEYTQLFDERQDYEDMGLEEWREHNGYDDSYGAPSKLWPVSFVLDLTAMQEASA
jgi:hypothetical protein